MGCGNCGTSANGTPSGCKSNGGCSTGGCNRLNVYDWLNALPLHDSAKPYPIVEVTFNKGSRKEFFRNNTHYILEKNDWIAVEGMGGYDIGQLSLSGELVKLQLKKYGVKEQDVSKRVLHPATAEELEEWNKQKGREAEMLIRSRAIARSLNLEMKLCEVEIQADSKKGTFFYTADQRVDFRELIKLYAGDFKMKVEMRQIGARQESGKVGGIGSCGRELCCSTWLTDFKSVNTTAARYQNLSINQTKLSGQCGRLKCCLNYELDTYMDALSVFPDHADSLETVKGVAHLQKRDIFRNLMMYSYSDNNKQYPLTITRVKEILLLNRQGQKADELQPVELEVKDNKPGIKVEMGFVNDVGQVTLKNLEHKKKKKKSGGKPEGDEQGKPQNQASKQGPGAEKDAKPKPRPEDNQARGQQKGQQGQQPKGNKPQQKDEAGAKPQQNQPQKNRPAVQEGKPNQPKGQPPKGNQPQQNKPRQNEARQNEPLGAPDDAASASTQAETASRPEGNRGNQPKKPQGDRPPRNQNPQGNQNRNPQNSQNSNAQNNPRPNNPNQNQQNRPKPQPKPNPAPPPADTEGASES